MRFHIYVDRQLEWRWRLMAANNRVVADSAEGYKNRADCLTAIGLVMATNAATPTR